MSYYLSFIVNAALLVSAAYFFRKRVVNNTQQEKSAKNWFSSIYALAAILVAVFGYGCISYTYELFGVNIDHGHASIAYVASGIFNVLIGVVGIIVGRILIGWKSFKL